MISLLNVLVIVSISLIYLWAAYNVPVLAVGLKSFFKSRNQKPKPVEVLGSYPKISVIVPAKNEGNVVGRVLSSLLRTNYPSDKREVVVVEDGSKDNTLEVAQSFTKKYPGQVKVVSRRVSDGKPSALIEALKHVSGNIVGVFDADNVVEEDCLLRVASRFQDREVVAVQGNVKGINSDENMLTTLVANEENLRYEGFCRGKDVMGLFVPLMGTNYFVRKDVLEQVGGWDSSCLSEDMELAVKLIHNGKKIDYDPDLVSWQEHPSSIFSFFKQRIRWWRGTMEVGLQYGKLLKKPNRLSLDAELTLAGSFAFLSYILGYFVFVLSIVLSFSPDVNTMFLYTFCSIFSVILLGVGGAFLFFTAKPRKIRNLLYVPVMYAYWVLLNFVACYAFVQMLFRTPKKWNKTKKSGTVANSTFQSQTLLA